LIEYKFNEDVLLDEIEQYIASTYAQHYSQNNFQSTEVIMARGHGEGFCLGNIDKYVNRYGNKGSSPEDFRKDLIKIIHYGILALYNHDKTYEEFDYENQ